MTQPNPMSWVLKKNLLTETIFLSTHNIGFECQLRVLEFENSLYLELCFDASTADDC